MAEEKFDPYHAWLGIPKWDQPANAYRLLGIEAFEQNRKVIEAAANRQMAYLQELSSGDEHIEEAQNCSAKSLAPAWYSSIQKRKLPTTKSLMRN